MRTAEDQAFSFNCFLEAAFVDLALAVGTDLDLGFCFTKSKDRKL